jgi:hypothetical protein
MPDMRRGKKRETGFNETGFLEPIGRGVGNIARTAGEHVDRSLTQLEEGWRKAGLIASGKAFGGRCIELSILPFSIRVPEANREHGGVNQMPCPTTREERCGGCILNCAGQEGFSFEAVGSALDVALGIDSEVKK